MNMNIDAAAGLASALVDHPGDVLSKEQVCALVARNVPMADAITFKRACGFPNLSSARMDEILSS